MDTNTQQQRRVWLTRSTPGCPFPRVLCSPLIAVWMRAGAVGMVHGSAMRRGA